MFQPTMTRLVLLLGATLTLRASASFAQIPPTDVKQTVGFIFGNIHIPNPNQNPNQISVNLALGTGFFVAYPDARGGPDFAFYYFVTAKHVLRDADNSFLKSIELRLNLKSPKDGKNYASIPLPVSDERGNLLWFQDPDDAMNETVIYPLLPDLKVFDFKAIPTTLFANKELLKAQQISEGASVFFVGLMAQFYGENKNFPVLRKGSLALLTEELLPTPQGPQHGYICEVGSWPGNSGAPVFLYTGGLRGNQLSPEQSYLLGTLIAFYNDSRSGHVNEAQTFNIRDTSNIGLAFVLPADRITKVLDSPSATMSRERQILESKRTKNQ